MIFFAPGLMALALLHTPLEVVETPFSFTEIILTAALLPLENSFLEDGFVKTRVVYVQTLNFGKDASLFFDRWCSYVPRSLG